MISSKRMQEIAMKMGFTFTDYVGTLEQERKKVLMFQRELPLCLDLITQAIDCCRQELSGTTSESSEQSSGELGPVLEEFIPIKRTEEESHKSNSEIINNEKSNSGQSDWLRSAQLWNQTSDSPINQDLPEKTTVVEVKRNGGAFQPFQRERTLSKSDQSPSTPVAASSSTAETAPAGSGRREESDGQNQRKHRRCWSPELHRRFLHALQQLGGSHAATPKQIREMMKVDGLTNDEVKSHLQKYRLHTRRPSPAVHNNGSAQATQFLVVGGIWVPTPEYAAVATPSASPTNGVYAPVAAVPPPPVTQSSKPRVSGRSDSGGGAGEGSAGDCNSGATSFSSPTSTVSPGS